MLSLPLWTIYKQIRIEFFKRGEVKNERNERNDKTTISGVIDNNSTTRKKTPLLLLKQGWTKLIQLNIADLPGFTAINC